MNARMSASGTSACRRASNFLGVCQLAWGVVAVARARVNRCRGEEALGHVRPEPFGRETRALRELTYCHEVVHKMKHEPSPMVRVKLANRERLRAPVAG